MSAKFESLLSAYKGLKHIFRKMRKIRNICLLSAYKGLKLENRYTLWRTLPGLLSAYKGLKLKNVLYPLLSSI